MGDKSGHTEGNRGHRARVLVFDSGVGGLSILEEIRRLLPATDLLYASDNGFFPYGPKEPEELEKRVISVLPAILEAFPADLAVVACNTASTVTLPALRRRHSLPFVGVVPAIKPAAAVTRNGIIGLLATPWTVRSPYTAGLHRDFASGHSLVCHGSIKLVEMAEEKIRGRPPSAADVEAELEPLFRGAGGQPDTVVLGCTHFPLLREELAAAAPCPVRWLDSGAPVARRVGELLGPEKDSGSGSLEALFTARDERSRSLEPVFSRLGFRSIHFHTGPA